MYRCTANLPIVSEVVALLQDTAACVQYSTCSHAHACTVVSMLWGWCDRILCSCVHTVPGVGFHFLTLKLPPKTLPMCTSLLFVSILTNHCLCCLLSSQGRQTNGLGPAAQYRACHPGACGELESCNCY